MNIQSIISGDGTVCIMHQGKMHVINTEHPAHSEIVASRHNEQRLLSLLDIRTAIQSWLGADTEITKDGRILYRGIEQDGQMVDRILQQCRMGFDVTPSVMFFENCLANPGATGPDGEKIEGYKVIEQLYSFLQAKQFPLTDDGCFLAYKNVQRAENGDLWDGWTYKHDKQRGTFLYNPGCIAQEPREICCSDPSRACGRGLHAGNFSYISSTRPSVVVKVNPRDVVSVPTHETCKLRSCRIQIIAMRKPEDGPLPDPIYGIASTGKGLVQSAYLKRNKGMFDNPVAEHWNN
jgi:hypothetical protein